MPWSRRRGHIQDSLHNLIALPIVRYRCIISICPLPLCRSRDPVSRNHGRQSCNSRHFLPPLCIQALNDTLLNKDTILARCLTDSTRTRPGLFQAFHGIDANDSRDMSLNCCVSLLPKVWYHVPLVHFHHSSLGKRRKESGDPPHPGRGEPLHPP